MTSTSDSKLPPWPRRALCGLALLWWLAEWLLALPPILRDGFGPWHRAALARLHHDIAFQLVVLDYVLTYAVALTLSIRRARRDSPRRWPLWALAFLLATAPALLLFWATRPQFISEQKR